MSNDCVCPNLDREIDRAVYGAWHETDRPLYPADLRKAFEAGRASVLEEMRLQDQIKIDREALRELWAMTKVWCPSGGLGWLEHMHEQLPGGFDV